MRSNRIGIEESFGYTNIRRSCTYQEFKDQLKVENMRLFVSNANCLPPNALASTDLCEKKLVGVTFSTS
jgi:hypothetical protein